MTHHVTLPLRKPRYLRRLKLWIWQERIGGHDVVMVGDTPPAAAIGRLRRVRREQRAGADLDNHHPITHNTG